VALARQEEGPPVEIQRNIANGPQAAIEARRLVDSLEDEVPAQVLDDVRLVATELVTNSYKHAGNPPGHPIEVTLDVQPDHLRLVVIDRSVFDPTPETSTELRDVKWGLVLLDRIADGWGRISEGGLWAEFRLQRP
jgi:anti-sigma regulatory factor (Ser/Thr protein kinase)